MLNLWKNLVQHNDLSKFQCVLEEKYTIWKLLILAVIVENNPNASLIFTLDKNNKVKHHIKNSYNPNVLRFWVRRGVNFLYVGYA